MQAGTLRHRIAIQTSAELRDDIGGVRRVWMTVGMAWAHIAPLKGTEVFSAQAIESRLTHKITLRGYTELDPRWRLVWIAQDRAYNVYSVRDIDERHRVIEVLAMEIQPHSRLGPDEDPSPSASWA